jgi:two-component system NarL family response regulator
MNLIPSLLIVDDDARMRGLIRSIVADLADSITECDDGAEAEACYTEHHPDWVLMDLMMPRMNGLEATRRILFSNPAAKIVMVSGRDGQSIREAAESAGVCAFVSKENLLDLRQLIQPVPGF